MPSAISVYKNACFTDRPAPDTPLLASMTMSSCESHQQPPIHGHLVPGRPGLLHTFWICLQLPQPPAGEPGNLSAYCDAWAAPLFDLTSGKVCNEDVHPFCAPPVDRRLRAEQHIVTCHVQLALRYALQLLLNFHQVDGPPSSFTKSDLSSSARCTALKF